MTIYKSSATICIKLLFMSAESYFLLLIEVIKDQKNVIWALINKNL